MPGKVYTCRDSSVVTEAMGEGYSWAPPGLSPSRVEEYMRQLPVDKVSMQCSVMLQSNVTTICCILLC